MFLNVFTLFPGLAFHFLKLALIGLSAVVVATTLVIYYRETQDMEKPSQRTPLIVAWTKFFKKSLKNLLSPTMKNCNFICDFIDREEYRIYKGIASSFILHGRNIDKSDLPKQSSSHLIILFLLESPDNVGRGLHKVPQDFFNATITYRRDSRYFWPHGHFELRRANDDASTFVTEKQLFEAIERKDKGSLIIVSHCGTHSKREHIIRELGKFTDITIKGRCEMQLSTRKSTRSTSLITENEVIRLIATYRFYIAFENSNCNDYVTEKYFDRISQLLVPVVLSRKIYEGVINIDVFDAGLPPHSFIAADDFNSIKELGEYLNSLRHNNSEYLRYFDWTHTFRKPNTYVSNALCKICEDIHSGEKMTINDIREYYGANQCTSALHAHRLLAGVKSAYLN